MLIITRQTCFVNPSQPGDFFIDFSVGLWDTDDGALSKAPGAAQRQAVYHTTHKGGDGYANYIDVSCSLLDDNGQSKQQKPPLWQVTVSIKEIT